MRKIYLLLFTLPFLITAIRIPFFYTFEEVNKPLLQNSEGTEYPKVIRSLKTGKSFDEFIDEAVLKLLYRGHMGTISELLSLESVNRDRVVNLLMDHGVSVKFTAES